MRTWESHSIEVQRGYYASAGLRDRSALNPLAARRDADEIARQRRELHRNRCGRASDRQGHEDCDRDH